MDYFSTSKPCQEFLKKASKKLKKELPKERYNHSVGVAFTAASLAMKYSCDVYSALVAGLLHDCAKAYDGDKLLELCEKYNITPTKAQESSPELLHAVIGSFIAKEKYGVEDEDILNAIASHTTGHADMTLLEEIIFIADYIEPSRKPFPGIEKIRELAFCDIRECIIASCEGTISHLIEKKAGIDPMTQETLNYYKAAASTERSHGN